MALIVVFPVLPFMLTTAELGSVVSCGDHLDFLPAELALKRPEYFGSIWRVGVYRWMFFPPLSSTLVTAKPLPFLFWFIAPPTVIAERHTLRSTLI